MLACLLGSSDSILDEERLMMKILRLTDAGELVVEVDGKEIIVAREQWSALVVQANRLWYEFDVKDILRKGTR